MRPNSLKESKTSKVYGFLAFFLVLVMIWGWMSWTRTPQLEANDAALRTIDALFTAINSHDEKRVESCRTQLDKYTSNGNLSPQAMAELAKCCEQAKSGSWEDAAHRLYRIIENQ